MPSSTGGLCFCGPPPVDCAQSDPLTCGGACTNPNDVCTTDDAAGGSCFCAPPPCGPVTGVLWTSSTRFKWDVLSCAVLYNVYRQVSTGLVDTDGDGLADDHGSCFPPTTFGAAFDTSNPPPGSLHHYLVTGEDSSGKEGPLGSTSAGLARPNRSP